MYRPKIQLLSTGGGAILPALFGAIKIIQICTLGHFLCSQPLAISVRGVHRKFHEKSMKNERDTVFLVKSLDFNKIQPVGNISEKWPFFQ